jgi:AcrR family transcriptional regulator
MSRLNAKKSMHRPRTAAERRDEPSRRQSVVRSSIAVLASQGYAGCTVREITQLAGITRTSFYSLFRDKDDVLNTILEETSSHIIWSMQAVEATAEEWPDKVYAGLRAMLDFFASDPDLARVAFVEAQIAGPKAVSLVQGAMRQYTANLASAFSIEGDQLTVPPPTAPEQVAGAIYFTLYDAVERGNASRLLDLLPLVTEIALSPYLSADELRVLLDRHRADEP